VKSRRLLSFSLVVLSVAACKASPPPALTGNPDTSTAGLEASAASGSDGASGVGTEPTAVASTEPPTGSAAAPAASQGVEMGAAASAGAGNALKQSDSGKSLTLAVGGTFSVELRSSAGTGFVWEVTQGDPGVLSHKASQSDVSKEPGGAVTHVFSFVAKAAGKTHVEIVYRRPWEQGKPPAKTFKVDVTVK
jgi:predicted secreted protein